VLFPAFAQANNIPADSVTWVNVAPPLREPMLFRGEADAITAFISGAFFALRTLGSNPADIMMFRFNDHGVDIYGNALMVPATLAQAEPNMIRAVVRATVQGLKDVLREPAAAIAAVRAREQLANPVLEDERMRFIFREVLATPSVAANGVGNVDPARAANLVTTMARAFDVANPAPAERLFRTDFLPPAADRMLPPLPA